jgi:hypothetical protein
MEASTASMAVISSSLERPNSSEPGKGFWLMLDEPSDEPSDEKPVSE